MSDEAMRAAVAQNRRLLGLPPQASEVSKTGCPDPLSHGPHMLEADLPDGTVWHIQCVGRTRREARLMADQERNEQ